MWRMTLTFMHVIPPVCTKMLKRWSRMTGQPGRTILKNRERDERSYRQCDSFAHYVTTSLHIEQPCLSNCYIICLSSKLMETQADMSHRTTSHKQGRWTKVERRENHQTNVTLLSLRSGSQVSPEEPWKGPIMHARTMCQDHICLTVPCEPATVDYGPLCALVPCSWPNWAALLQRLCVWSREAA